MSATVHRKYLNHHWRSAAMGKRILTAKTQRQLLQNTHCAIASIGKVVLCVLRVFAVIIRFAPTAIPVNGADWIFDRLQVPPFNHISVAARGHYA
jgi:hypothetical protein